jgi:translation initiation factor 3 subunit C
LFEVSESKVHAIVSGMMLNEELKASWDQPTKTIVLHHVEPSSLQNTTLKYSSKIAAFLESNESLLESRYGNFSYKNDGKQNDEYVARDNQGKSDNRGRFYNKNRPGGSRGDNQSYDDDRRGGYRK